MEHRLAEFRAQRRMQQQTVQGAGTKGKDEAVKGKKETPQTNAVFDPPEEWSETGNIAVTSTKENAAAQEASTQWRWLQDSVLGQFLGSERLAVTNLTFLKVLLWLVLLGLFVELEFGLAFFVLSLFYWLYEGTRDSSQRRSGEPSAYSVFNPGCQAIQGTLTAEQFEGELGYRPFANR
ncbi:SAYSvFN domain-containing protein 1-like [Acipenser oxyrinchus oxyrinchus]|uniref:SAYSvFN domain-containing protein 1-like n=1 Tax=Acipenser oxyrinchus oxyrinchus TaxID=40147 RepID=A0AAD8G9W4_ACIOX|nr:SAYSvFN domain-containing protein 1-like [Acipenser oxyrinchus oxyrinchus]